MSRRCSVCLRAPRSPALRYSAATACSSSSAAASPPARCPAIGTCPSPCASTPRSRPATAPRRRGCGRSPSASTGTAASRRRACPSAVRRSSKSTNSATALERCRGALVGHGGFDANLEFHGGEPAPVHGQMLAFNGRAHGHSTVLLHVYASKPADITIVLTFAVRHPKRGKFGTELLHRHPAARLRPRLRHRRLARLRAALPLPRPQLQLPQRPLRRPERLPGGDLLVHPRHLLLLGGRADPHLADPQLHRPLAAEDPVGAPASHPGAPQVEGDRGRGKQRDRRVEPRQVERQDE